MKNLIYTIIVSSMIGIGSVDAQSLAFLGNDKKESTADFDEVVKNRKKENKKEYRATSRMIKRDHNKTVMKRHKTVNSNKKVYGTKDSRKKGEHDFKTQPYKKTMGYNNPNRKVSKQQASRGKTYRKTYRYTAKV